MHVNVRLGQGWRSGLLSPVRDPHRYRWRWHGNHPCQAPDTCLLAGICLRPSLSSNLPGTDTCEFLGQFLHTSPEIGGGGGRGRHKMMSCNVFLGFPMKSQNSNVKLSSSCKDGCVSHWAPNPYQHNYVLNFLEPYYLLNLWNLGPPCKNKVKQRNTNMNGCVLVSVHSLIKTYEGITFSPQPPRQGELQGSISTHVMPSPL